MKKKKRYGNRELRLPNLATLRNEAKWTQEQLAANAKPDGTPITSKTVSRIENGGRASYSTAKSLVAALDGRIKYRKITLEELEGVEVDTPVSSHPYLRLPDWELGKPGPCVTASNGLQWQVFPLFHKDLPKDKARGKLYDLRGNVPTEDRHELKKYLRRHPEVCQKIHGHEGHHPNVARHRIAHKFDPDYWWVIDEWIEGKSLNEHLEEGPLPPDRLPGVMRDILQGLQALHKAGIIRRELSPRYIYLTDDRAVLTDFELAKLLDTNHSVSVRGQWRDDDEIYRAKEVGAGTELDVSCDLLSWAVILAHAIAGQKPSSHEEAASVLGAYLSKCCKKLKPLALDCLNRKRHKLSIEDLISVCKRWK